MAYTDFAECVSSPSKISFVGFLVLSAFGPTIAKTAIAILLVGLPRRAKKERRQAPYKEEDDDEEEGERGSGGGVMVLASPRGRPSAWTRARRRFRIPHRRARVEELGMRYDSEFGSEEGGDGFSAVF